MAFLASLGSWKLTNAYPKLDLVTLSLISLQLSKDPMDVKRVLNSSSVISWGR